MKRALWVALAVGVVAVFLISRGGDDDVYSLKARLADAGGLRDGSPVVIGGVAVGQVELTAHRDYVQASLDIKPKYRPISKNAVIGVIAQNVIGQKQIRIEEPNKNNPAPDGYVLPPKQILETTDLDQLLDTLDPDTRTRLAILINEAGTAFAGRKMDFHSFLSDVPAAFANGGQVLNDLTKDNRALENLVQTSDPFVKELADQRQHFVRVLANAGETTETIAARRAELQQTLHDAPAALRTIRGFLAELQRTTGPLDQTARLLTTTAPSLSRVLDRVGPFERDAGPTIEALEPLGPILARVASKTTPIVQKVARVSTNLRSLSANELPPVGSVLMGSADNTIATLDNWSHAIQFRDAASHVFRGEASFAPDFLYQSLIDRLLTPGQVQAVKRRDAQRQEKQQSPTVTAPAPTPTAPADSSPHIKLPGVPQIDLPPVAPLLDGVLKNVLPQAQPADGGASGDPQGVQGLLDYLLKP